MGKRILVTGASGRVGRVLILTLLERRYEVRVIKHRSPLKRINERDVEVVQADLLDYTSIEKAVRGVNMLCHLAAFLPPGDNFSMFDVNVRGTFNVLEAARRVCNLKRFIFGSTDATYPTGWSESKYRGSIDENQLLQPALFYGASKVIGEVMCRQYHNLYKIPIVCLRFCWIMAEKESLSLFSPQTYMDFMSPDDREKYRNKDILIAPLEKEGLPYFDHVVDVRDLVQGIVLSLEKEEAVGQTFNIAGPAPFSYREEAKYLSEVLKKPYAEVICPKLFSYEINIAKARNLLGYNPKFTVRKMLEEALTQAKKKELAE